MKRTAFSSALILAVGAIGCRPNADVSSNSLAVADSARLHQDVAILASDAMEGRGTGSAGNDSAAAFITRRYGSLGLRAVVRRGDAATCAADASSELCRPGFLQPFVARSVMTAHAAGGAPRSQNVVALVPGRDPALRGQVLVIGGHFDHLGRSPASAMDPERRDAIRNGADDNASGTAVVMELARLFARSPARRSILFVNFSGEELGLLGSQWFVENSPVPLDSVQAMLNFDMVGRLSNDRLTVYGVATATELPAILDSSNVEPKLSVAGQGDGFGASDHSSFYAKGIPVLHFFTGIHEDYHRASDKAERINAAGMARVTAYAERIARRLADRPDRLTPVRAVAAAPQRGARAGTGVYLGSIPDMSAADVTGVRLMGVRAGSPADKAGLKEGDVIVEFAGSAVTDLQTYSDALYAKKPGDTVKVVVMRGAQRLTLDVTLGRRGG